MISTEVLGSDIQKNYKISKVYRDFQGVYSILLFFRKGSGTSLSTFCV